MPLRALRNEWVLAASCASCLVFAIGGRPALEFFMAPRYLLLTSALVIGLILFASFRVVRHAEALARRLGEPLGTLILTLSVITIEVASITAVMLHGENNPTLARETVFAVLMILLNGVVGVSVLMGGWIHREQHYNLPGANAYMSVIVPLAVLSLIVPDFTRTTPGPTLSLYQQIFLATVSIGLYLVFLGIQTGRHRDYFGDAESKPLQESLHPAAASPSALGSGVLVLAYLLPVLYLADLLAHPIDYLIETLHAPTALGGVIVALLVATPEALGAIKAARRNELQRSVNISLGSVLSTIGLTIPAMLLISSLTHTPIELGLQHTDTVMLLLTLFCASLTFASGRTNVLQGCVHILLFLAYFALIFQD